MVVQSNKGTMPRGKLAHVYGNGCLFCTYSLMISGSKKPSKKPGRKAQPLPNLDVSSACSHPCVYPSPFTPSNCREPI